VPGYVGEHEQTEERITQYMRDNRQRMKEHARTCAVCRNREKATA